MRGTLPAPIVWLVWHTLAAHRVTRLYIRKSWRFVKQKSTKPKADWSKRLIKTDQLCLWPVDHFLYLSQMFSFPASKNLSHIFSLYWVRWNQMKQRYQRWLPRWRFVRVLMTVKSSSFVLNSTHLHPKLEHQIRFFLAELPNLLVHLLGVPQPRELWIHGARGAAHKKQRFLWLQQA